MLAKFELYFIDTETTGLEYDKNSIVELSIYRLSDDKQRTWCLKPKNGDEPSPDALRVNGHKLPDITHQTKFGQETYLPASKILPLVENYFLEDGVASTDRILIGQNPEFDLRFLKDTWEREGCKDTFPFGPRPFLLDTRQLALFLDLVAGTRSEYYNLGSLIKKYGIKNTKAHTAEADTLATKELFMAQLKTVQDKFKV